MLSLFSFQELDLSAGALLLANSIREEDWKKLIESSFQKKDQYRKVISKQLVGMLLLIYAKQDLIPFIQDVATDSAATGILGIMVEKPFYFILFYFFSKIY